MCVVSGICGIQGQREEKGMTCHPGGTVNQSSARDRSQWRSPSSGWEEQSQERTTRGTRVPMELGSTVVLV